MVRHSGRQPMRTDFRKNELANDIWGNSQANWATAQYTAQVTTYLTKSQQYPQNQDYAFTKAHYNKIFQTYEHDCDMACHYCLPFLIFSDTGVWTQVCPF